MLWSPRSTREATAQHNWSVGLLTAARESPCGTEEPMQPQIKINTYIFKLLVQSSSSPSLICHLQGTLQRALRNFLKLVLSPSHFQSSVKLVFQNESFKKKKKKFLMASHVILVTSQEGERNIQIFAQPLQLLISLREARVMRFCPRGHTLS